MEFREETARSIYQLWEALRWGLGAELLCTLALATYTCVLWMRLRDTEKRLEEVAKRALAPKP